MSSDVEIDCSIVIVTFNNRHELRQCLSSLIAELGSYRFEIILVDNHSGDSTPEVARRLWAAKPVAGGTLYILDNDRNRGFTKALNQGLRRSCGRYILVLNPDTELKPGCLARLRQALDQDEKVGIVAPQLRNPDGSLQPSCRRFPRHRDVLFEILGLSYCFQKSRFFNNWKMGDFDHSSRLKVDQPQGACLMFERDILQRLGLWDEAFPMFFSDVDWCLRVRQAGYEILFEPAAQVVHHKGASVLKNRAQMIWSSHISFYHYFKKHKKGLRFGILNELFGLVLLKTALLRIILARILVLDRSRSDVTTKVGQL